MVVGAEVTFRWENSRLCRRGHVVGRLSVDIDVEPSVDLLGIKILSHESLSSEESTLHTAASVPTALSKAQAKFFEYPLNLRPNGHATVVI